MELVETPLAELAPEVQERISVIGFVEGDAKAAAFAQADAYVLASENENFGISVAEALATATPVIISDQVAIAPAVETSEAGIIVSSLTPEAVADAILRVLDPDTNQVMSQHAKELANREFSWSPRPGQPKASTATCSPRPDPGHTEEAPERCPYAAATSPGCSTSSPTRSRTRHR